MPTRNDTSEALGYIVMFGAHKGGVGKSVLATNLAVALAMKKEKPRVALVEGDSDGSHSVLTWGHLRSKDEEAQKRVDVGIFELADPGQDYEFEDRSAAVTRQLAELQAGYDYIIIDGPPKRASVINDFVSCLTDLVILPLYDLVGELLPQKEFADHLGEIRDKFNGHFKIGMVLNRVPGAEKRILNEQLRAVTAIMGVDCNLGIVCLRKIVQHTFGVGVGVIEGRGDYHDRKCKDELLAFRRRVLTVLSKIGK